MRSSVIGRVSVAWDVRDTAFQRLQAGNFGCTTITNL